MAALDPPDGIKFADFELTLTDRDLDDFLSFMEHQTNGVYADSMPQLPDVAVDFPGLQLQPHSGSPSHSQSEGSESAGVAASGAAATRSSAQRQQGIARSDGSLTSATMSSPALDPAAATSMRNGQLSPQQQQQQQQVSPASSPMDISSQQRAQQFTQQQVQQPMLLQQPQHVEIKEEPELQMPPLPPQQQQQQQQQFFSCSSLPGALAASASSNAAATGTTLAGSLAGADSSALMGSCPGTLDVTSAGAYCLQPLQWHSSTAITAASAAAAAQQPGQPVSQAMPQLLFVQGPVLPTMQQQQQQQQPSPMQQQQQQPAAAYGQVQQQGQPMGLIQPSGMSQQLAAFAGLTTGTAGPSGGTQMDRQASLPTAGGAARCSRQQLQQQRAAAAYSEAMGGSKLQVSHSTVEKQRRDRLNSLIDELSDMVPPADPKYGNDTNSVRRPKHVVLADTINLLKAMQTKLQIEEAEICTLKQQAAAVGAIAAQHQAGHAAVPEAAEALMHAAAGTATAGASPETCPPPGGAGGYGEACGVAVELPTAPESSANATGVLVEQGIGCLYVKVNCRDRKGLLSDVVSALKGLPIVISTAAITTTKDGTVHDVFEVRVEDASVTAEDIQCAVQQALFMGDRARSKRLRRAGSDLMQQDQ